MQIKRQRLAALQSKVKASRGDGSVDLDDTMDAMDAMERQVGAARDDVALHEAAIREKLEELMAEEVEAVDLLE